jgi:ferredoxin
MTESRPAIVVGPNGEDSIVTVGMDQDMCSGCSICSEIQPQVFLQPELSGGADRAFVHNGVPVTIEAAGIELVLPGTPVAGANSWVSPDGKVDVGGHHEQHAAVRVVTEQELDATIEAAEECPGKNIWLQLNPVPQTPESDN